ncbi:putative calcium-binding protein CML27 [Platanthera guangdongensis]|uniref:Calcium-binding protein CML27 n=1 Tax=Platanthera guangdongensis TaxID=2320717 RepID=A0ABR2M7L3_9ASPA
MTGADEPPPTKPSSQFFSRRPTPARSFRLRSQSLNSVRLRRVFDLFDHNSDGEITIEELSLALDRLGLGADLDEISSIVAAHISPGQSGLDYLDFEDLHRALGESLFAAAEEGEIGAGDAETTAAAEETDMEEAFRVFDEDGDGFISAVELQVVLKKLGLPEAGSFSRVNDMICSVDRNQDGRVDFIEFKHMMRGISVIN